MVFEYRMVAWLFDVLKALAKSWTASLTWAFIFFLRRAARGGCWDFRAALL